MRDGAGFSIQTTGPALTTLEAELEPAPLLTLTIVCHDCGEPFFCDYEERRCWWCVHRGVTRGGLVVLERPAT